MKNYYKGFVIIIFIKNLKPPYLFFLYKIIYLYIILKSRKYFIIDINH